MMSTPTNNLEGDPICFMDSYSSLLSPFTCFEIDGYDNIPNGYHDESVLLSAGNNFGESSNEPVSASSKMDATTNYNLQGDVNGIVEQDNSRDTTKNNSGSSKQNSSRRRASKGDRHSKIPTAQGLRDRRMRLSLDVARQFFGLQDLLRYDKPSQTVRWLLMQAGPAIDELKEAKEARPGGGIKGVSSNSELGEEVVVNRIDEKVGSDVAPKATSSKEKGKHTRKDAFSREAKELRKKARERARERTQNQHQAEDMRPFYKTEQQVADNETFGFCGIAQDFHWSQNCYHQEDHTAQYKPIQEFQSHGWEPYYG